MAIFNNKKWTKNGLKWPKFLFFLYRSYVAMLKEYPVNWDVLILQNYVTKSRLIAENPENAPFFSRK